MFPNVKCSENVDTVYMSIVCFFVLGFVFIFRLKN